MKSDWTQSTLEDLCVLITDGAHNSPASVTDGEYMVSVKDFTEFGFDFSNCKKISKQDYAILEKQNCVPQKDDILIGKDGARYFEDIIIYRQSERPALLSSIAILRADTSKITPEYLFYTLKSPSVKKDVRENYGSGSAIPRIVIKDFKRMTISFPKLEKQGKIVSTLKALDDKIALNQQINKNLEEQAQAIIRNYCESITQNTVLREILSFENGFAFQSRSYLSVGRYRIITIKNVQDGRIDSQGAACIDEIPPRMKPSCSLAVGDVLLSLTGNVGRVGIVCEDRLLLNQRVAKLQPNISDLLPWLYYYFRLPLTKTLLETIAKGTAQPNLSPVETLNLSIPFELDSALELSTHLQPMFNQEIMNNMQSIRLASLRDALLPRLMSGEIDVSSVDA